jgi:hypothetical protein
MTVDQLSPIGVSGSCRNTLSLHSLKGKAQAPVSDKIGCPWPIHLDNPFADSKSSSVPLPRILRQTADFPIHAIPLCPVIRGLRLFMPEVLRKCSEK